MVDCAAKIAELSVEIGICWRRHYENGGALLTRFGKNGWHRVFL